MKRKIAVIILNLILLSCSHHMIKDYIMVTDNNKREYFRVFQEDTSKVFEYCHNNFLPARYQPPAFQRMLWIDIVDDTHNKNVSLFLRLAVTDHTGTIQVTMEEDSLILEPAIKPFVKKKKGKGSIGYLVNSYTSDILIKLLDKIAKAPEKISGLRCLGVIPKDTVETRAISGVPIVKEQYKSRFYEFDENEKLGIKNTLELYEDLKRKY